MTQITYNIHPSQMFNVKSVLMNNVHRLMVCINLKYVRFELVDGNKRLQ